MFVERYTLIVSISVLTLGISVALDQLLSVIHPAIRFFIQVPILVILIDELRLFLHSYAAYFDMNQEHVNGAFYFSAPLAALASGTLFKDIRSFMKLL